MNEEKFCRYGCGMRIKWVSGHKMPIEISPSSLDIQKAQGRKPHTSLTDHHENREHK
jgi:hypothetical protein